MTPAAEHESAGEVTDLPEPGPCSAAGHLDGTLGCAPAMPATWVVEFAHGAPGGPCSAPILARVCDGRRAWIDGRSIEPARCIDCGRLGYYSELVRIVAQL